MTSFRVTAAGSHGEAAEPRSGSRAPVAILWVIAVVMLFGQLLYLPTRLRFVGSTLAYSRMDSADRMREAVLPADWDMLRWLEDVTPSRATILLVTTVPSGIGDPDVTLYHRALYHLYPRTVWWARPVQPHRRPVWWIVSDPAGAEIDEIVDQVGATFVLSVGLDRSAVEGPTKSYAPRVHLTTIEAGP